MYWKKLYYELKKNTEEKMLEIKLKLFFLIS